MAGALDRVCASCSFPCGIVPCNDPFGQTTESSGARPPSDTYSPPWVFPSVFNWPNPFSHPWQTINCSAFHPPHFMGVAESYGLEVERFADPTTLQEMSVIHGAFALIPWEDQCIFEIRGIDLSPPSP
jgi:hypothetical protein